MKTQLHKTSIYTEYLEKGMFNKTAKHELKCAINRKKRKKKNK